ncbi:short-chain dehydrogenase [Candidatus Bathyarchaeota archaeon]|nr:MAG: short-chain dehydrogenase [Candidatus Bathyarchaeota archaeon]
MFLTLQSSISIKDLFRLDGKKAIVTGSGGGIGGAIAEGLAEFNVDTALFDVNFESITRLKKKIEDEFSIKALAFPVDVCDSEQVKIAVKRVFDEFGRIDILVNCHGIGQWSPAEEMSEEDWKRMLDVNLTGVFLMCQAVGRFMIKQRHGKIINISSMSGSIVNKPQPQAHYNASKAGVIMLTKSLAAEWARYNINVNSISPGYTLTPLVENLLKQQPEYADMWRRLIPLGRFAKPRDIVGAVIFLASDAANYVTGHNLAVDGGYTIW